MWPIEVIRVVNDPEKYAKNTAQKEQVEQFKKARGYTWKVDRPKNVN